MLKSFPPVAADAGVVRRVLSDSPELMVVSFTFDGDAIGKLHDHPHVQATYVQSGRFAFTIGADEIEVGAGDSFVIPSGARHGCRCLEPGVLIDTFTPRRDDFL
ncbi:cupin domain-containing protein [Oceaniglobus indicus]|uniref:cupin domain-containing protein n=1 Tax=Oceaniglobus indicus TaxID=2047749 RepID=UPI000C180D13|nr:cupin domain-containing protein [Oceaniglobus indicus]